MRLPVAAKLKSIFDIDYDPAQDVSPLVSQHALGNFSDRKSRIDRDFKAFAKPFGQKLKIFSARFYNKGL